MNEGLLQTKLLIPQKRPSLVARPHLFEKLNAGLAGAITLVAAPAGFGKTTLIAEWVRHEARFPGADKTAPAAWLSLDRQDNDLAHFLAYLIAALNTALDGSGDISLAILQGPQMPDPEAIITHLINALGQASEPMILVLDDYQVIKEQRIHDVIAFLLGHLPPSLHLVLVSRADPPLPLARLRGQGALNEVRQDDLSFTDDETAAFLNEVLGLNLAVADLQRLNRRTEGWPAGLQMAALSLRQQEDPAAFIQAFTGSNRYILDYLMEEVLARQSPAIQRFLLSTSVLERLTESLCATLLEAVPGSSEEGGESILEYLDGANLFVVPLDDKRHWYRYHRLFADLLRQRLYETGSDLVPVLHARARDWYWREGWQAEAIAHALQADDDGEAVRLIEEAAESAFQKSQLHTISQWIEALPEEQLRQHPRLSLYYAWALFLSGASLEEIETYLPQLAGQGTVAADESELLPATALMHAFMAAMRGQMQQAGELSLQALDGLGPEDRFWRSMAAWVLSISHHEPTAGAPAGDWTWEDAIHVARQSGNLLVMVSAMCEQGHAFKRHGRLREARDLFAQALALATPLGERPLPVGGEALMGMAEIDLEWNDLDSAEALLLEGLERTRQWREIAALPGCFQLARLRQARGDSQGADAALREASRLAVLFDATELDDVVVAAYQARLWIMQGRPGLVQTWIGDRDLGEPGPEIDESGEQVESIRLFEELIQTRLWLVQGELDAALSQLDRLLPIFTAWQHVRLIIEALLLRAQVCAARGEQEKALATLQEALVLGEPGEFVRLIVDEGESIWHLLEILHTQDHGSQAYVDRLIDAFGKTSSGRQPQSLIEPLSARELEILQLIAEGMSNREIGQRLFISLSTVKWHTSNIYGKLGVKNRTTAVATARELDILPHQ